MINPNACKRVLVEVEAPNGGRQFATYRGSKIEVNDLRGGFAKAGKRRLYLTYSIICDQYFLSVRS